MTTGTESEGIAVTELVTGGESVPAVRVSTGKLIELAEEATLSADDGGLIEEGCAEGVDGVELNAGGGEITELGTSVPKTSVIESL